MSRMHLDCVGGISGDMFFSAVSSLLGTQTEFEALLRRLPISDWGFSFVEREECGIMARVLNLKLPASTEHDMSVPEIRTIIQNASFPVEMEESALGMLARLAEAEGRVHGVAPDDVHFHELGGMDTVVDLSAAAALVYLLKPDRISSSPLPMGQGMVRCEHGLLPLPTPATAELLKGVPVRESPIQGETVTPTGAAIVRHYVTQFSGFADGTIKALGVGAGQRKNPDVPNILRAFLLEDHSGTAENLLILETNIDDMNPQHFEYCLERLFAGGALDVWLTPIIMKKSRPAQTLSVLARFSEAEKLESELFTHTTTLGVRRTSVQRNALSRNAETRHTPFGDVLGKRTERNGHAVWVPEYEELKRLARESGLPLAEIIKRLEV